LKYLSLAIDFIDQLLSFDPANRISAEGALSHPYLAPYHYPDDEVIYFILKEKPSHPRIFDFSFEAIKSIDEIKSKFL
jgi:mitogen-activated protein kinase 7